LPITYLAEAFSIKRIFTLTKLRKKIWLAKLQIFQESVLEILYLYSIQFKIWLRAKKIKVRKEEAIPLLIRAGSYFIGRGGIISLGLSSAIIGIKSFLHVKQKIYNQSFNRRYVEIRIKQRG